MVLQWILKIAQGQWDHWNKALHQSNTQLVLDTSINLKINAQYNLRHANLPKTSRNLLHAPHSSTLNLNHQENYNGLCHWKQPGDAKNGHRSSPPSPTTAILVLAHPGWPPKPNTPTRPRSLGTIIWAQPVAPQGAKLFQTPCENLGNLADHKVLSTIHNSINHWVIYLWMIVPTAKLWLLPPHRSNNDWPFRKFQVSFHPMTSFKPTTTSKKPPHEELHRMEL